MTETMAGTTPGRKRRRIIQVGAGGWGKQWLRTVPAFPERAEYAALVDVRREALDDARQMLHQPDLPCFSSLEEALKRVDADALICVVPPMHHEAVVIPALEAGLHVLCEKPIADTLESCHRIVKAARSSRGKAMVSQKARYHPWVRRFREAIRRNEFGGLAHVTHYYKDGMKFWGQFRHEMPDALFVEMSIHHFDLMRAYMGNDAVSVWAESWNPPWSGYKGDIMALARFRFQDGVPVIYTANKISRGSLTSWYGEVTAEAEHGALSMIYPHLSVTRPGASPRVPQGPREDLMMVTEPDAGQNAGFTEFLDAIEQDRQPESSIEDNMKSVAMMFAAIDSARQNVERQISDYLV